MNERVPSNEATPESTLQAFVNEARAARRHIDATSAQVDALLQHSQQTPQKELDLSDPPGFDEDFRGTTYR